MSAKGTKTLASTADNIVQDTVDEIDDLTGLNQNKKSNTESEPKKEAKKEKSKKQKHLEDAAKIVSDRTRLEALSTENVEVIKARLKRQKSIISSNEISLQRSVRDYQNTTLIALI